MMPYSFYPATYQPFQQTYQPFQPPAQQNQTNGTIWVQGEAGAKAYPVAAGMSVILMDSESECFYIKSADASGMPMPLRVFDYAERKQANPQIPPVEIDLSNYVTQDEFDALKAKIEALAGGKHGEQSL